MSSQGREITDNSWVLFYITDSVLFGSFLFFVISIVFVAWYFYLGDVDLLAKIASFIITSIVLSLLGWYSGFAAAVGRWSDLESDPGSKWEEVRRWPWVGFGTILFCGVLVVSTDLIAGFLPSDFAYINFVTFSSLAIALILRQIGRRMLKSQT